MAKGSGSGAARLTAWAAGGSILYASDYITDTSFVTTTDVFTATSSLTNVYILCGGGLSAGTAVFDDISITKVITDGIQNDLDGEDFIETSGSAIYHGGLEYNGDGSFRGIQSFESRTNVHKKSGAPQTAVSSGRMTQLDITYDHADLFGDQNIALS